MKHKPFRKKDIENYVFPELEMLGALFARLKLRYTTAAFEFFKSILMIDLEEFYTDDLFSSDDAD